MHANEEHLCDTDPQNSNHSYQANFYYIVVLYMPSLLVLIIEIMCYCMMDHRTVKKLSGNVRNMWTDIEEHFAVQAAKCSAVHPLAPIFIIQIEF